MQADVEMNEDRQSVGARRSGGREKATVSLVRGERESEAAPSAPTDAPVPEPASRLARVHPDAILALKVLLAVLVLGLPLSYIASLDTPGLGGRAPSPPPQAPLEGVGLGVSDFDPEQSAVIARIGSLVDQEKYREALKEAKKYPDLAQVQALQALAQLELDRQREAQILEELKRIPVSEFERNRDRYAELVKLNPDEPEYQKKLEFYDQKVRAQRQNPISP